MSKNVMLKSLVEVLSSSSRDQPVVPGTTMSLASSSYSRVKVREDV